MEKGAALHTHMLTCVGTVYDDVGASDAVSLFERLLIGGGEGGVSEPPGLGLVGLALVCRRRRS